MRDVPLINATVHEGDALFIPTHWWHQVNSLPPEQNVHSPGAAEGAKGNMAVTVNWNAFIPGVTAPGMPPLPHLTAHNASRQTGLALLACGVLGSRRAGSASVEDCARAR